jgi:hypothetical protein
MSHFVIIELFKQFMSEGWSINCSKGKVIDQTKLQHNYVRRVINEDPECQELMKAKKIYNKNKMKNTTGETTWS